MQGVVYRIYCLANGKNYIGQSRTFSTRISTHFNQLAKGIHLSRLMQEDYDYYGRLGFCVEELCRCPYEYMSNMERFFIGHYRAEYNNVGVNKRIIMDNFKIKSSFDIGFESTFGGIVEESFVRPIVKAIPREVVKKGVVGRPRKEVVGVRAIQYRNKADGLSRSVGRPKKDK
jgi:hypothetical protein